jgi:hypothetical protein
LVSEIIANLFDEKVQKSAETEIITLGPQVLAGPAFIAVFTVFCIIIGFTSDRIRSRDRFDKTSFRPKSFRTNFTTELVI